MAVNAMQQSFQSKPLSVLPTKSVDDGDALTKSFVDSEKSYQQILMAVMKNQIPGEDHDPMKMMEGIFQMISAGQQSKQTHILEKFGAQFAQLLQVNMSSYIGRQVGYESDNILFKGQPKDIMYTILPATKEASVQILDKYNKVVREESISNKPGLHHYVWDGKSQAGIEMPEGEYRVYVKMVNHSGIEKPASTVMIGQVQEVSVNQNGKNLLIVDGHPISVKDVRSASRAANEQVTPELIKQIAASMQQQAEQREAEPVAPLSPMQQAINAYQPRAESASQRALDDLSSLI